MAMLLNPYLYQQDLVQVEVGSFTKTRTTAGTEDYTIATDLTAAASGSWAIIFWHENVAGTTGVWGASSWGGQGFAANGGGTISQYGAGWYLEDAAATSNTGRSMAAAIITKYDPTGAANTIGVLDSFPTSTSLRVNYTTNSADSMRVSYAIISGITGAKVVNWQTPTTVTTKTVPVTGVDLSSDGLVLTVHATKDSALPFGVANAYFGFGAMNIAGEQWANAFYSADNAADSNSSRWQRTDSHVLLVDATETALIRGDYNALNNGEFVMDFPVVLGTAFEMASLCMSGVRSKIGSFNKTTSAAPVSQNIATGLSFIPKAAFLSSFLAAASTTPTTHGILAFGATDGTNQRADILTDEDAQTTTNADHAWFSDATAVTASGFATTGQKGTVNLGTTTTVDWTGTDATAHEFLYLLIG